MRLIRVMYHSQSMLAQLPREELDAELMTKSRVNNQRNGITGLLIADDLWFVQVLEGAQKIVWQTFDRIREDPRHLRVMIVEVRDIAAREFGDWSMNLVTRTPETQGVFAKYGAQVLNPSRMSTEQVGKLLNDLSKASGVPVI
ncbi:MAG: hypothetical protein JWL62_2892 [Hyphomicrobiales bacterium]|nr:hypothetical protein [Hyphomicrobiales bacterium]